MTKLSRLHYGSDKLSDAFGEYLEPYHATTIYQIKKISSNTQLT